MRQHWGGFMLAIGSRCTCKGEAVRHTEQAHKRRHNQYCHHIKGHDGLLQDSKVYDQQPCWPSRGKFLCVTASHIGLQLANFLSENAAGLSSSPLHQRWLLPPEDPRRAPPRPRRPPLPPDARARARSDSLLASLAPSLSPSCGRRHIL